MNLQERKYGFRLSDIGFKLSGKKAIVETEIIHGMKLNIIFTFCNKSTYDYEFKEWTDFQDKMFAEREKTQKVEGFKIYNKIKTKRYIGYREFTKICVPFFSRTLFEVFKDNPDLFLDREETTLHIKIERAERWEYDEAAKKYTFIGAFPYSNPESFVNKAIKEGLLDLDHYYIAFSIFYVLQSIVAPYLFLKRVNYIFLYKYLAHELEHYKTFAEKYYHPEFMLKERIGLHMARKSDYSLTFLYTCLCDLRNEGLADFRKKRDTTRILIVPKIIKNFRNLVKKIPIIKKKKDLEEYYEKEIYAGSMEGVYYCGYIMCFFIAYSLDTKTPRILFKSGFETEIRQLPKVFNTERKFFISPPSKKAYGEAYLIISKAPPIQFLELYEKACIKLGLSFDSMVLTTKLFRELWEKAEYIFQRNELRAIKRKGFYPKI